MAIPSLPEDGYTPAFRVVSAFVFGLVLSPLSLGLLFFIAVVIFWEILFFGCNGILCHDYKVLHVRAAVIAAGLSGFLLGRIIVGDKNPCLGIYSKKCQHCKCAPKTHRKPGQKCFRRAVYTI